MKNPSIRRLLINFIVSFLGCFIMSSVSVTVAFIIFLDKVSLPRVMIHDFEPYTVIALLIISFIYGILSTLWEKTSVEQPVAKINEAFSKIKKGDLASRLDRNEYSQRYSALVKNINFVSDELSSLENMRISLLSNISHELKTPVSVISNYAELLQNEIIDDEKRIEYAEAISESTKKMTELINDVMKLNHLENRNIPCEMKQYNLSEQICECLLPFEEIWEEKEIEVFAEIDDEIIVTSDRELMNIVWNNILANAFKFTPEGGSINVLVTEEDEYALVRISDTGCGITKEHQSQIFDKFFQCDSSRGTDGHGLGLALVKRVIDITDNKISVESEIGCGTTFTVKIHK